MQLRARNTIQHDGKIHTPAEVFEIDDRAGERLVALGAAEVIEFVAPLARTDDGEDDAVDLEKCTKAELQEIAREYEIEFSARDTRAELIEKILDAASDESEE
jgi:hypothetical protein